MNHPVRSRASLRCRVTTDWAREATRTGQRVSNPVRDTGARAQRGLGQPLQGPWGPEGQRGAGGCKGVDRAGPQPCRVRSLPISLLPFFLGGPGGAGTFMSWVASQTRAPRASERGGVGPRARAGVWFTVWAHPVRRRGGLCGWVGQQHRSPRSPSPNSVWRTADLPPPDCSFVACA